MSWGHHLQSLWKTEGTARGSGGELGEPGATEAVAISQSGKYSRVKCCSSSEMRTKNVPSDLAT